MNQLPLFLIVTIFLILCNQINDADALNTKPCPKPATNADINEGDTAWIMISSALVLLMTPGLAFFYGGLVRKKNVVNTLMMSYVAMGVIMIHYVLVGYTFSFGPGDEGFGNFKWGGLKDVGMTPNADYAPTIPHIAYMNFQMMFAVITPALISGGVVERINFRSYILFIIIWTTLIYDPLSHWMWSGFSHYKDDGTCEYRMGWLRAIGSLDFAGGTVIHISAGFSALIASYIVGKRTGYNPEQGISPNNVPFVLLGAGLLWFGWIGFNGGSALFAGGSAALAVTNTSISAASGFLTWLTLESVTEKKPSAVGAATGAVIGMVAMTPGSGYVLPGFALLFGTIAALFCYTCIKFKKYFRVDDSLDVFFCHGIGGITGTLMTGLFATKEANPDGENGAFYGNAKLFAYQLLAVVVAVALSCTGTAVILLIFKYTPIGLRTDEKWEEEGMDMSTHKEEAFDDENTLRKLKSMVSRRLSGNSLVPPHSSSSASASGSTSVNMNSTTSNSIVQSPSDDSTN